MSLPKLSLSKSGANYVTYKVGRVNIPVGEQVNIPHWNIFMALSISVSGREVVAALA
jgi:hypothetical protein